VTEPGRTRKILTHVGEPLEHPPLAPAADKTLIGRSIVVETRHERLGFFDLASCRVHRRDRISSG